ncbi:Uncharacterized protein FWK35_00006830 [Aphis craccivora]|uniref:Uncharacterized protein n=1 Tax=Aphis craccivora TaxID=307492 RepID=A0A6G0ZJF3_APHCR|nr:Uncharacterized protein FWK35_00006830 [Aphis craccivora]
MINVRIGLMVICSYHVVTTINQKYIDLISFKISKQSGNPLMITGYWTLNEKTRVGVQEMYVTVTFQRNFKPIGSRFYRAMLIRDIRLFKHDYTIAVISYICYMDNNSERSDECIDFTMIITNRNNAPISNFKGGFRKSEYPWCIIEVKS